MSARVEDLLQELEQFFAPLVSAFSSPEGLERFLRALGYDGTQANLAGVVAALAPKRADLDQFTQLVEQLQDEDRGPNAQELTQLLQSGASVFGALRQLPTQLAALNLQGFFGDAFDYLLVEYLYFRFPLLFRVLVLLGVLEIDHLRPGQDDDARQVPYDRYTLRWERLSRWIEDPSAVAEDVYGWGTAAFDFHSLLDNLAQTFIAVGLPATPIDVPAPIATQFLPPPVDSLSPIGIEYPLHRADATGVVTGEFGLLALPVKGNGATDAGIGIMPYVRGNVGTDIALSDDGSLSLKVQADASLAGGVVFSFHPQSPQLRYTKDLLAPAGDASFRIELRKAPAGGAQAIVLLGDPAATRLDCTALHAAVGGENGDFYIAGGVAGLRLVLDLSSDGLLGMLVSAPVTIDAGDLVAGWRIGRGIYFEQGAGIKVRIPLQVALGPIRIHLIGIDLFFAPELATVLSVNADATIGPLFLGVEGLGLRLTLVKNENGQFGRFDIVPGLQFPTGYAAALNGGPIQGGGALFVYDHEYRGALALKFQSFGLAAFAILTTRLPGGQQGFSFLASLFGEFEIQLGYGFKLTGLGGIIGIHRTANVEALRTTLQEGRLDSILFPAAPIQDASIILQDMASIFPARQDQHLFGPMAKIAWGTPTLIEGKLGVVLELGREVRVLILGSLVSMLPVRDAAIVVFNLDFIGVIDFSTGAIGFDATLANSRILTWPVSGEAAVRTGWGANAGLVASIGGLHPQFPLPANFPTLQRLTIAFGSNNPSVTLTAYVAVTLNSVQAGAHATLYARGPKIIFIGRCAAEGWVGFDAIIRFDPFEFDAQLTLGLRLLIDGDTICGLGGDLRLRGPNTYRISGKVWVSVFGVDIKFPISHTWGSSVTEILQTADPLAVLRKAIDTATGFEPIEVTSRVSGVTFRSLEPTETAINPSGGLSFLQRAIPLDVAIDRLGTSRLAGPFNTFRLVFSHPTGGPVQGVTAEEDFVRGEFFELSDNERLRGPATARFTAGLELEPGDAFDIDARPRRLDPEYEYIFVGEEEGATTYAGAAVLDPPLATAWIRWSAGEVAKPLHTGFVPGALATERISVAPERFAAVDNRVVAGGPAVAPGPGNIGSIDAVRRTAAGRRVLARHLAGGAGG